MTHYTSAVIASFAFPPAHDVFRLLTEMIENDKERKRTDWLFWNGTNCYMINYTVLRTQPAHANALAYFDAVILPHISPSLHRDAQVIKIEAIHE